MFFKKMKMVSFPHSILLKCQRKKEKGKKKKLKENSSSISLPPPSIHVLQSQNSLDSCT